MIKIQHPWQVGPTELIEFALERMHKGSDVDRRLAFLILDVGVETLFKTYLTLPSSVMQFQINRTERDAAVKGNFHDLLRAVQNSNPEKSSKFFFAHVEHYHTLRNKLYHEGNQVTAVPLSQLEGYARLAVDLLKEYLDVDLLENLKPSASIQPPQPAVSDDPVVDSVETQLSSGRYKIERLRSQTIRVWNFNTGTVEVQVLPFLRKVIDELELPINLTSKTGGDKNTRMLGKDVIDELKPSPWHGLLPGQKVKKDTIIALLTGRIREGKADEKNWEKVDFVRSLRHDVMVFQPGGSGFGNSPFNMRCWYTESGEPIIP